MSFNIFASVDNSKFRGQIYKKSDLTQCLKDYDTALKNVETVVGYKIIDGGCSDYGSDALRLEFDYVHPVGSGIQQIEAKFSDLDSCRKANLKASEDISLSENQFVYSFCQNTTLTIHYINTSHTVARSLPKFGKFDSLEGCVSFLADLTNKAKKFKMTSVISKCDEYLSGSAGKKYFVPSFNYVSNFKVEMKVIAGKISDKCSANRPDIEQTFMQNNIDLVSVSCLSPLNYEQGEQEIIMYLIPRNGKYITDYEGIMTNSMQTCEAKLDKIVRTFEVSGQEVLYSYCKKISELQFRPIATYIKILE